MRSKIFAVVMFEPNQEVEQRIDEAFPGSFRYNECFSLVRAPFTLLSTDVARAVGLKGPETIEEASGFVIQQRPAYAGYTRPDLWEWLGDEDEEYAA